MPSRIVTTTYRYKRPPPRKPVPLTGPAIVRRGAAPQADARVKAFFARMMRPPGS